MLRKEVTDRRLIDPQPADQEGSPSGGTASSAAKWYVAELTVRFDISGQPDYLYHVNTILLLATSADAALEKANGFGIQHNYEFTNTDGESVTSQFVGLRQLFASDEELKDGTELFYEEVYRPRGSSEDEFMKTKRRLAAFSPR